MRRRRLQHILAWLVVGSGMAWSIYDWLVVDEGLRYFAEDRRRILLLLVIVAVGTPVLLAYEALSGARKRSIALWVVGLLAVGATVFAFHFVYGMARLAGFFLESGTVWMGVFGIVFPVVIAVGLWWAFCRILQGKPI